MAELIQKLRKSYVIMTQPIGEDEDLDKRSFQRFLKVLDFVTNTLYFLLLIFGCISFYLLITKEAL